ncbi:MAG: hypothetical protein KHX46_03805 [Clostridiales bacterium]|nr:hypothetical protein [Clostridiales bacterium]
MPKSVVDVGSVESLRAVQERPERKISFLVSKNAILGKLQKASKIIEARWESEEG